MMRVMPVMWRFLTRQGSCPPLIALLLTCSVAACAAPFSNKDTPLAQNTPIVYADDSGSLDAISGRDGSPLWHTLVGGVASAQVIVGDAVYATVYTSAVAVRLSDGHLLWRTAIPYKDSNQHLYSDGQTIIVDGGQAGLTGLDPSDGSIRWSRQVQTTGRGVLHRGVYYIFLRYKAYEPDGTLVAYRPRDGVELWRVPSTMSYDLFANDTTLFAKSGMNTTVALSSEDGHQLWSNIGLASFTNLVGVSPRIALVNEPFKPVDALDALNGHPLWKAASADFSAGDFRNDSVTAVADLIIGAQNHDTLIALHERDGAEAWRVSFQGFPYLSMPGVRAGVVFVYLEDPSTGDWFGGAHAQPQIAALDATTGAVYWRVDVPHGEGMAQFGDAAP
jgi:outer membrane protein assembly factor BamB